MSIYIIGFPDCLVAKSPPANAGDAGSPPPVPPGKPLPGSDPTSNDGVSMEDEAQESVVF